MNTLFLLAALLTTPPERLAPDASCLADGCHAETRAFPLIHAPIEKGQCRDCHPQQGDRHAFTEVPPNETCAKCHESVTAGPVVHSATDKCLDCHTAHGSANAGLLIVPATALCQECHEPDEYVKDRPKVHEAVTKGECLTCHEPHAGSIPKLLRAEGPALCKSCHEERVAEVLAAKTGHSPAKDDCTRCHDPHASKQGALLHKPQMELCLECHDKAIEASDGRTVASLAAQLEGRKRRHGPVDEGKCAECHSPHGSPNFRLLKLAYPPAFYAPGVEESFALCFDCHDAELLTEEHTEETKFRDGDKNLHFVHVNRGARGRTCRACHSPHASDSLVHVRETTPFGTWGLPVGFTPTKSGGGCSPGCHVKRDYDRGGGGAGTSDSDDDDEEDDE